MGPSSFSYLFGIRDLKQIGYNLSVFLSSPRLSSLFVFVSLFFSFLLVHTGSPVLPSHSITFLSFIPFYFSHFLSLTVFLTSRRLPTLLLLFLLCFSPHYPLFSLLHYSLSCLHVACGAMHPLG